MDVGLDQAGRDQTAFGVKTFPLRREACTDGSDPAVLDTDFLDGRVLGKVCQPRVANHQIECHVTTPRMKLRASLAGLAGKRKGCASGRLVAFVRPVVAQHFRDPQAVIGKDATLPPSLRNTVLGVFAPGLHGSFIPEK